jgi:hypothetical protein
MDGGDSLQIRKATANIFNKQLWTADKRWSFILGLREGLITPHCEKLACFKRPQPWQALVIKVMNLQITLKVGNS